MTLTTEELIMLLESTANFLRGMCLDRRIPQDTKEAIIHRVAEIDRLTELWESQQ